ncbi:hypothetical protein C2S53_017577 [Perilla frutescens var. hirtella]|uniref:Uncharacterized protein n=1 Tax=Perilla frutescens var. hirtella TaxID=608512 RepID=A0AAD4J1R5_PERFH|nr:hypothetical protein C2S53_017577 [Perilla frutescens var. hirtella]
MAVVFVVCIVAFMGCANFAGAQNVGAPSPAPAPVEQSSAVALSFPAAVGAIASLAAAAFF